MSQRRLDVSLHQDEFAVHGYQHYRGDLGIQEHYVAAAWAVRPCFALYLLTGQAMTTALTEVNVS